MEQLKTWEDNLNNNFIYFKSEKELTDYIKFNNITYFCIEDKNKTEPMIKFAFLTDSKILYINDEFYNKNKIELDDIFVKNMIFSSDVMIPKHLYSEELIYKLLFVQSIIFDEGIKLSDEIKAFLVGKNIELYIKNGEEIISLFQGENIKTQM